MNTVASTSNFYKTASMRIAKFLLAACVVIGPLAVRAGDDSDIQAKAREALEKKVQEATPAQPAQPAQPPASAPKKSKKAPAPAPAPAPTPAPAPAPAPAAQAAPAAAATTTAAADASAVPTPANQADIDKAREALHQKMDALNSQPAEATQSQPAAAAAAPPAQAQTAAPAPAPPPAAAPAPVPAPEPALAPAPAAAVAPAAAAAAAQASTPAETTSAVPTPLDDQAIAKAREAMRQKMQQTEPAPLTAESEKLPAAPRPQPHTKADKMASFPALHGPPTGLSADKEQRLQTLLQKYKADEITPEQYHAERAKIIGDQQ